MEKLFMKDPNVYGRMMEIVSSSIKTITKAVKVEKAEGDTEEDKVTTKKIEKKEFKLKVFISSNKAIAMYIPIIGAKKISNSNDIFDILTKEFVSEEGFLHLFHKQNKTFKKRYLKDYQVLLKAREK